MAYYKPCTNCAVDKAQCPIRAKVSQAIVGLYVTSINFRCTERTPMFRLGQRVSFSWTAWEPSDYGDDDGCPVVFKGTVLQEHGLRFIVRVDDAPAIEGEDLLNARDVFKSDRLVIKVRPAAMKPLHEPDRVMCPVCCAYEDEPQRCQAWLDRDLGHYEPNGCLHRKQEVA